MNTIEINGPTFLMGDIHGREGCLIHASKSLPKGCNIIILGDIGIGFRGRRTVDEIVRLLRTAKKEDINNVYIIRGNHDDPKYWSKASAHAEEFKSHKITFIPDGTVLVINGTKCLCIGGGTSVDRMGEWRVPNESYWVMEDPYMPDYDGEIDVLLSHSGMEPPGCDSSFVDSWCKKDSKLRDTLNNEQALWLDVFNKYNPKKWFYAHFHNPFSFDYKNAQVRVLDIEELIEFT